MLEPRIATYRLHPASVRRSAGRDAPNNRLRLIGASHGETRALRRLGPHARSPRWTRYAHQPEGGAFWGAQPLQPAKAGCRGGHPAQRAPVRRADQQAWLSPPPPWVAAPASHVQRGASPQSSSAPWGAHRRQVTCPAARQSAEPLRPPRSGFGLLGQALNRMSWAPAQLTPRPLAGGPIPCMAQNVGP